MMNVNDYVYIYRNQKYNFIFHEATSVIQSLRKLCLHKSSIAYADAACTCRHCCMVTPDLSK